MWHNNFKATPQHIQLSECLVFFSFLFLFFFRGGSWGQNYNHLILGLNLSGILSLFSMWWSRKKLPAGVHDKFTGQNSQVIENPFLPRKRSFKFWESWNISSMVTIVVFIGSGLVKSCFTNSLLDLSLMLFEHIFNVSSWWHQWSRVVDSVLLWYISL